ncbi:DUF1622 domain-containing protein [Acidobacteriota bacterium]
MEIVKTVAEYAAHFVEAAAVIVIVIGAIQTVIIYIRNGIFQKIESSTFMQSRLKLGQSLSLGLGFLVGADVIKTAISPKWLDIGQLAAIVAIRIVLNTFLMRDLKQWESHSK